MCWRMACCILDKDRESNKENHDNHSRPRHREMLINKVSKSYNHSSGPMKSIAKNRISFVLLFHELILKFDGDQRREERK